MRCMCVELQSRRFTAQTGSPHGATAKQVPPYLACENGQDKGLIVSSKGFDSSPRQQMTCRRVSCLRFAISLGASFWLSPLDAMVKAADLTSRPLTRLDRTGSIMEPLLVINDGNVLASVQVGDERAMESKEIEKRVETLLQYAREAYSRRDFDATIDALNELLTLRPGNPSFLEMRATAFVDCKKFSEAIIDFDRCLKGMTSAEPSAKLDRARVLSGKALALEGIDDFLGALDVYKESLDLAISIGAESDPYVLNSIGNCYVSLGEWSRARSYFQLAGKGFQTARRDGAVGTMQQRLDGAVFAASNAALMLAQLGDTKGAIKEMQAVARRAPGSADMRIALAAMLWDSGMESEAENQWAFACDNITVGCSKYQDEEWLRHVRRWPPVMVERLQAFLALQSNKKKLNRDSMSQPNGNSRSNSQLYNFKE